MRPWKLAEVNYGIVKEQSYEVAVLPLGATEPHNLHLPYGTDIFEADLVGEKICEAAWNRGAKVVLLPTIPYGTQTNQMQFPLAMNLNPATLVDRAGRPGRVARAARHSQDRALEQPRRQRAEAGAAGALRPDAGQAIPVQLVHGLQRPLQRASSARPTTMPARWRPR